MQLLNNATSPSNARTLLPATIREMQMDKSPYTVKVYSGMYVNYATDAFRSARNAVSWDFVIIFVHVLLPQLKARSLF